MDKEKQAAALANVNKAFGGSATTTPGGAATNSTDFFKALQNRILGDGGVVSSEDTGFEKAIAGVKTAGEAQATRIESQAGREIAFQTEQFGQRRETVREGQRGFAVNSAAMKQLDDRTEKSLKDMEQRKQELLLSGEESTARQVSQLQVQAMQFKQQKEQEMFSNLLASSRLQIQQKAEDRAASQFKQNLTFRQNEFNFRKQSLMFTMAAEAGVAVAPGDTIESLSARIAPIVAKEKRAKIAALLKESEKGKTELDASLILSESIQRGDSPVEAMKRASAYYESRGLEITEKINNSLTEQARQLFEEFNVTKDKVIAEETKSISDLFAEIRLSAGQGLDPLTGMPTKESKGRAGATIAQPGGLGTFGGEQKDLSKLDIADFFAGQFGL